MEEFYYGENEPVESERYGWMSGRVGVEYESGAELSLLSLPMVKEPASPRKAVAMNDKRVKMYLQGGY